ncbi:MAG: hemin receptor [Prevotella sp.]|nr:hemin receptor [Prevotella sp.]MBR0048057.1 hemin receptor [Prevotella sp.]
MRTNIYISALLLATAMPMAAQDTYESARLMGEDLNGTARYVGMGGALDALGADISTISTNPAGIGLFRHSTVSASVGLVSQQDAKKFDGLGKTNLSFDQIGFVYTNDFNDNSFINFAFNYHKSRNFDQLLSAANSLHRASLNKTTYAKVAYGDVRNGGFDIDENNQGELMGYEHPTSDLRALTFSQLDYLQANALLNEPSDGLLYFNDADAFIFDRAHRGWIANYDFNLSGNVKNRFYWGVTIGARSVNYKGYTEYTEGLVFSDGSDAGIVTIADERKVSGTGYSLKGGIIFRPLEYSPLRFGLSVSTPTWYDLKTENTTLLINNSQIGAYDEGENSERYDFKLYTPWTFGLSAGNTIGNNLAIGLGVDYADYGATRNRINDGYDAYGDEESYTDENMKRNTERSLKGVATVKAGIEYKPDPALAIRLGYNYVSPMYDEGGFRDATLNSYGVMYSSTADYTNWKSTNRITCGMGFKAGNVNIDLAYQYNTTSGDFYPFQPNLDFKDGDTYETNVCNPTKVTNKRHQLLLTLGYTF